MHKEDPNAHFYPDQAVTIPLNSTLNATPLAKSADLPKTDVIIWSAITLVVSVAGALCCCTAICVVLKVTLRRGASRSGSNLLIVNYLFLLFISAAVNTPIVIHMVVARQLLGQALPSDICRPVQFVNFITGTGISYVTAALSIHRILALKCPTQYARATRRPVLFLLMALSWLATLPTNVPYLLGVGGSFAFIPGGRCGVRQHDPRIISLLITFGGWLPFAFSTLSALFLLATVMNAQYRIQARTAPCPPRRRTGLSLIRARARGKRIRLTYTLLMATLIDGVLWKSWDIVGAMYPTVYAKHPMASLLSRTSIAVVSVLAPMIICVANSDFRKGLTHCITPWPRVLPQTACHSRPVIEPPIHHLPTAGHEAPPTNCRISPNTDQA